MLANNECKGCAEALKTSKKDSFKQCLVCDAYFCKDHGHGFLCDQCAKQMPREVLERVESVYASYQRRSKIDAKLTTACLIAVAACLVLAVVVAPIMAIVRPLDSNATGFLDYGFLGIISFLLAAVAIAALENRWVKRLRTIAHGILSI